MKTILFPTDFSTNAIHAAQYAGMLAKQLDAKVVLLHAYPIPIATNSSNLPIFDTEISVLQNREDAENNLAIFALKFIEDSNLSHDQIVQMAEYGLIVETIIETAKKVNADFIVMGTKGASNIIDKWLGINAQNVMKTAECPVWIIPQYAAIALPQTMLYAADFKEDEITATYKVLEIAQSLGATCKVIHVHEYFELNVGSAVEQMVSDLEDEFENDNLTIKTLNRKDIIEGLEVYIKTHSPNVLALAIYEKSFLNDIFNTSLTQHFVQKANLPMLIFKK